MSCATEMTFVSMLSTDKLALAPSGQPQHHLQPEDAACPTCRLTDYALLLADDLTQVLEDLVELRDALLDLRNLALTLLDELLLKVDVGVAYLLLRFLTAERAGVSTQRMATRTRRNGQLEQLTRQCGLIWTAKAARERTLRQRTEHLARANETCTYRAPRSSAASTLAFARSTNSLCLSALRRDTDWNVSSARWKSAATFCCSCRWFRCVPEMRGVRSAGLTCEGRDGYRSSKEMTYIRRRQLPLAQPLDISGRSLQHFAR